MNYPATVPEPLTYPCGEAPGEGAVSAVADGVFWVRMPLPFPPRHINMWLLRDGDGWTIVDTGILSHRVQQAWQHIFAGALDGRPVTRILCTHYHPDHSGLAGWLSEHWQATLWMSRAEWLHGRLSGTEALPRIPDDVLAYFARAGYSERMLGLARQRSWDNFSKIASPLPRQYRRIHDGERLSIGGRDWQVIVGYGHAPEHACLWSAELGVLISGDQILPRISPHIGVGATEPEANPLREYLDSFAPFEPLPPDALVLPSHGEPFRGLHGRIAQLRAHHRERLDALDQACAEPQGVVDLLPVMFRRDLSDDQLGLAFSETVAHLNLLLADGRLARELAPAGSYLYRRA